MLRSSGLIVGVSRLILARCRNGNRKVQRTVIPSLRSSLRGLIPPISPSISRHLRDASRLFSIHSMNEQFADAVSDFPAGETHLASGSEKALSRARHREIGSASRGFSAEIRDARDSGFAEPREEISSGHKQQQKRSSPLRGGTCRSHQRAKCPRPLMSRITGNRRLPRTVGGAEFGPATPGDHS